jgi:hypothetical protein
MKFFRNLLMTRMFFSQIEYQKLRPSKTEKLRHRAKRINKMKCKNYTSSNRYVSVVFKPNDAAGNKALVSGMSKCESGSNQRAINSLTDFILHRDAKNCLDKQTMKRVNKTRRELRLT